MDPVNIPAKFKVRSFTHSWDNRGYWKNFGRPRIRPRSLYSQIFKGCLFAWTLWIYLSNLKFVALHIPQIIGGTRKISAVPEYAHVPFTAKFLKDVFFAWTLWIYLPNLNFVPLPIPEIIGGTEKKFGSPWIRQRSLFSQIFRRLLLG